MPNIKLRLPPGVASNGTRYQNMGRWESANLVRWFEGAMQPVGGWTKVQNNTPANLDLTDPIRGMHGWRSNAGAAFLALSTKDTIYSYAAGTLTDITPAGFVGGATDAAITVGNYGAGNYSEGPYGGGTEAGGVLTEAGQTIFDNFGEQLVACAPSDGKIYYWDLNVANNLTVVDASAPVNNKAIVVTPERFLVALGAGGISRRVEWADQESLTVWGAASDNQAGGITLPGVGNLMCGKRVRTETLLWTDNGLWGMRFIGGVLVYSFTTLGENCGIIARRAAVVLDGRALWMGHRNFFLYDGFVKPIPCSISDEVFNNMNRTQRSKIAAVENTDFNEVWFMYPSAGSLENDRVAVYNYVENHWSGPWQLKRTDGIGRGAFHYPILGGPAGGVYYHERDITYLDTDDSTVLTPSVESAPIEIGQGDQTMLVTRVLPDENNLGDVTATIFAGNYPTATEDSQTVSSTEPTSVRLTGRQVRLKLVQAATQWRVGDFRLEVIPRGRR